MKKILKKIFISFIVFGSIFQRIEIINAQEEGDIESFTVGLTAIPESLNPMDGYGNASIKIFYNIYDTLLFINKDGEITGQLAESWDWIDDKTFELTLKKNLVFQNGETLDSSDVKYTFDMLLNGEGAPTIASLYDTLDSVKIIDDLTVQFNLNTADSAFEQRLGSIWGASIIPNEYMEKVGSEEFQIAPIGSGPYKLIEYSPEKLVFERSENFWGELPKIQTLIIKQIPEASARITGLLTGELDLVSDIPSDQIETINSTEGVSIQSTRIKNLHLYTFYTLNEDSIMSNNKFRQALAHSIDRQLLVDSLWYDTQVPNGHQFELYGDLYIEDHPKIKYDPEYAKKLLAESGYDGEEIISIEMNEGYYLNGVEAGQAIADMWNEIGIKAEVKFTDEITEDTDIRAWSNTARFDSPLGGLWMLYGPGSGVDGESWIPTDEFVKAGNTLINSTDLEEKRDAARTLLEVFDTYLPGTYLYQSEEIYGINDAYDWDLTFAEMQIIPLRFGDIKLKNE